MLYLNLLELIGFSHLPALIARDTLFHMATSNQPDTPEVGTTPPAWLEDASQSALLLGRLVQDPSIQAALILRGKNLWAQAGDLLEFASSELAQKVFQYWSTDGGRDLTRYVRLTSVPGEFIVYATGLTDEMVLAILYDEKTPFSKMRLQAAELAHLLLSSPHEDEPGKWIQEYPENDRDSSAALEIALASLPPLFNDVPPPSVSSAPVSSLNLAAGLPPSQSPSLTQPASPKVSAAPHQAEEAAARAFTLPDKSAGSSPVEPQTTPASPNSAALPQSPETGSESQVESMPKSPGLPGDVPISRPAPTSMPPLPSQSSHLPGSSPALTDLYLAVVLLPRLPKHHLVGDLAALLPQWVAQLCLAHGWRLESLRVRPDFMGWVVSIPQTTSARQHLRVIRGQTSQYIFAEFPTLARENPSGEFWAPGYLVTSSSQLPEENAIQNLIIMVRHQQGVSKLYSE